MFWNEGTEQNVRPGLARLWGWILILMGLSGAWALVGSVGQNGPTPISASDAHQHLDQWVEVSDVRFDCDQVFDMSYTSNNRRYVRNYVVMTSADGSVAALARFEVAINCQPEPARPVTGTFKTLVGTGPLGHMRRDGLTFPATNKPLLDFDTTTEAEDPLLLGVMGVIFFVTGVQAVRSGARRKRLGA